MRSPATEAEQPAYTGEYHFRIALSPPAEAGAWCLLLIIVLAEAAIPRRGRHAQECRRRMIPAGTVRPDKEPRRIFRRAYDRHCCRSRNCITGPRRQLLIQRGDYRHVTGFLIGFAYFDPTRRPAAAGQHRSYNLLTVWLCEG